MDSGRHPAFIALNGYADGLNIQCRNQKPKPRPPYMTRAFDFSAVPDGGAFYRANRWQGGLYYNTANAACFIAMVGGRIYSLTPSRMSMVVADLTPDDGNPATDELCWLVQADKFVVIQNGSNTPYVVKEGIAKRADGTNPIPVGTVMAYVQTRLWVARGQEFLAGDLVGSEDDAVLYFNEAGYLNEGGSFKPILSLGDVVSMGAIAIQDTSTGQGGLIVLYENGAVTVNGLVPRDQWKNTQIQQVTLPNIGATGHRSFANVNGDFWFRSSDGWRAYRQARAQASGWNQVPLSQSVSKYVNADEPANLRFVSAVNWDNRLLCTSGPLLGNGYASHVGILSLDFDPVSQGFGGAPSPSWDGLWQLGDANVCELLVGVFEGEKRCFAFSRLNGNNVALEIVRDGMYDDDSTAVLPAPQLISRRYAFTSAPPYYEKQLIGGSDIRLSHEDGARSIDVEFAQDDSETWIPWDTLSYDWSAPVCVPTPADCSIPCQPAFYSPRLALVNPPRPPSDISARLADRFYDVQFRFTWAGGYFHLESFRPKADVLQENQNGEAQELL